MHRSAASEESTIQVVIAQRRRDRPWALAALAVVFTEAAIAVLGGSFPALTAVALLLAPGLALLPLLPARALDHPIAAIAAAPALGFAAAAVVLVSVAAAGVSLDGTSVRIALGAIVLIGLLAFKKGEPVSPVSPAAGYAGVGLVAAVLAGLLLQDRVIGGSLVPGNDWAKYVLYADEVRRHGSLLIDNPFWMLGVPFREDPAVPAIYGGYLTLTGQPAAVLVHGIWFFAVAGILSTYVFVRAFWGEIAGVLAAGLTAVLPISQDILAWHGLANTAALALLPLVLLYLTVLVGDRFEARQAAGFGVVLVALGATHRLSFLVGGAIVAVAFGIALCVRDRKRLLRDGACTAAATVLLGSVVAYDLVSRSRTFGGTQDHTAYLTTKVDLGLVVSDLTPVFTAAAVVATALGTRRALRDVLVLPLVVTLLVVAALAYSWLVEFPLAYLRMAYFLPLALVPLVAIALGRLGSGRLALVSGVCLVAVVGGSAWGQAGNVRDYYAFTNPASLAGLDSVEADLAPGEVVVTDRCWSFLATWLLRTPTLPALEPEDIQPKAEVERARLAHAILAGTDEGRSLARRLGVRFLIVDPTCSDATGEPLRPPRVGTPVFLSKRLAVLRLGPVG